MCNRWLRNVDASRLNRGRFYRTKRKFLWQVALGQCKQVLHYLRDVSQGSCRLAQEYTDASIFGGTDCKCQAIRQSVADMTLHVSKKILPSSSPIRIRRTEEIVRDARIDPKHHNMRETLAARGPVVGEHMAVRETPDLGDEVIRVTCAWNPTSRLGEKKA